MSTSGNTVLSSPDLGGVPDSGDNKDTSPFPPEGFPIIKAEETIPASGEMTFPFLVGRKVSNMEFYSNNPVLQMAVFFREKRALQSTVCIVDSKSTALPQGFQALITLGPSKLPEERPLSATGPPCVLIGTHNRALLLGNLLHHSRS